MPAAFFTGQPGPDAIAKLNQLWAAFLAGAAGGTPGGTADISTLNAAVAAANASATAAATSATNAGNSATTAAGSATAANNSAVSAGNAATNAGNSATAAATSATNANNVTANTTAAATSATNAANSATAAATSATNSATSATNSANSATAAANSATAAANSAAAAAISAGTTPPASAPAAPTGLVAAGQTANGMTLTWNAAATATGYNVYRDGVKVTVSPQTALSFSATGLMPTTQYTWIVRAVNAAGESANATVVSSTTGLVLPAAPTGVTATAPTATTMNLAWVPVAGATGYNIYRTTGATTIKANANPTVILTFQDTWLTASTSYTWTITAVNSIGEGPASAAVSAVTSGAAINGLTPLATRLLGGYFKVWDTQYNITATPLKYGLVYLFNAQPYSPTWTSGPKDDIGDGTFAMSAIGEAHISNASIQAVRARGQKVVVTFGGAGANFNFNTRTRSNNFIASVKSVLASLQIPANGTAWGADGIDLNMFEAYVRDLSKSNPGAVVNFVSEITYICSELKAYYGANFIITMPPTPNTWGANPFSPLDGPIAKALSDNNLLTVANPQYYEYVGFKDVNVIKNFHIQWVTNMSGRQQQVGIGLGNHRTYDTTTLAEGQREVSAILALYPNTRMVFGWNIQDDLNGGSAWSNGMAQTLGIGTVVPPEQPPVTPPTADLAVTNAFAFGGGKIGGWMDTAPANLRQGVTKISAAVTTTGQSVGRIVDRSTGDNDVYSVVGGGESGTYRLLNGKTDVLFNTKFISATGGGSGQGAAGDGFYIAAVVTPAGYYHSVWSDKTAASFNGRELMYSSDYNGFIFRAGTGTDVKQAVVAGLGTIYVAPNGTISYLVEAWHDGTTLSLRVDGGTISTAACPTFAVGSVDYALSGRLTNNSDGIGRIGYSVHLLSPLTLALRDELGAFVATKK